MNEISKRNPLLAGILSLFLGPIGFVYIGGWFLVSGIIISAIFSVVLSLIDLPFPNFFNYLQLLVYSYFGHKLATIRNMFSDEWSLSDSDIKEFKSFGFSFVIMTNLLMALAQFYSIIVGLYLVYKSFADGKILYGILILVFGIALITWLLTLIFSFISGMLLLLFRVDKKYFQ